MTIKNRLEILTPQSSPIPKKISTRPISQSIKKTTEENGKRIINPIPTLITPPETKSDIPWRFFTPVTIIKYFLATTVLRQKIKLQQ
jgi:hypothetical protein